MDALSGDGHGMASGELTAPPGALVLREWPRAALSVMRWAGSGKRLRAVPAGDGRPILLLPGLFNSDRSNLAMRGFLNRVGYRVQGWRLGRNFGERTIGRDGERLIERVVQLAERTGQPVTLIGVSLGGIMARFVAHRRPDLVREVITVSAPFAAHPRATNVWRVYELLSGNSIDDPRVVELRAEIERPLPLPATAIWSASDGLVNGHACRIDAEPSIEVVSSHVGVQLNPDVLVAIAGILGGVA